MRQLRFERKELTEPKRCPGCTALASGEFEFVVVDERPAERDGAVGTTRVEAEAVCGVCGRKFRYIRYRSDA
jgi:hypothetical protein